MSSLRLRLRPWDLRDAFGREGRFSFLPDDRLHVRIVGPFAPLWRCPGDDLIRIRDVAGFAVHAIFVVDEELLLTLVLGVVDHLVDGCRAETFAGISVFLSADCAAKRLGLRRPDARAGPLRVGFR